MRVRDARALPCGSRTAALMVLVVLLLLCTAVQAARFDAGAPTAAVTGDPFQPRRLLAGEHQQAWALDAMNDAAASAMRSLQATPLASATNCPATTGYNNAYQVFTPYRGSATPPEGASVAYTRLPNYGWNVPATRIASHTTNVSVDFWSVVCNSFKNSVANRKSCTNTPAAGVGEVHLRYNCSDSSLWVLAYVYEAPTAYTLKSNTIFTAHNQCDQNNNDNNQQKQYCATNDPTWMAPDQATGTCSTSANNGACSSSPASSTSWCCGQIWPVLDAAGNQIGYLSRARFVWNATLPRSLDQFGVHFDWADASGGGGGTAFAYDQGALCLTCNGTDPNPPLYYCQGFPVAQCQGGILKSPAPTFSTSPLTAEMCCSLTCGNLSPNGTRATCPTMVNGTTVYLGPDAKTLNSANEFASACCDVVDVAIDISVARNIDVAGSTFNYTVCQSNVANRNSTGNNGFTLTIPAGVNVTSLPVAVSGAPAPSCVLTGAAVNCTINADLLVSRTWCYTFQAVGLTEGNKLVSAALIKPDSYAVNDGDSEQIQVLVTCGRPFATTNSSSGTCPAGAGNPVYLGNDATPLNSASEFASACCGIVDVVVNIAAAPATQVLGSPVAYTLSLQNVGRLTSRGNNGFVVRLQPGVNVTGLPTAQYGAPPLLSQNCTITGTPANGYELACSINEDLAPGVSWAYVFPGVGTSPGSVGSNITLIKPDSVASNNVAPAPVSFLYTCAGYVCPTGAPAKSPVSNTLAVPPTDGVCCCLATAAVYTDFSTRIRTNAQMTLKQVSATASTTRVTWGYFRHIYANKCSPTSNALLCQKSTYPVPPLTGTRGSYENGYCLDSVVPIFSNTNYFVKVFSAFDDPATMKCGSGAAVLKAGVTRAALNRVHWLINNYYNHVAGIKAKCTLKTAVTNYVGGAGTTAAGNYSSTNIPGGGSDVQVAVWNLLGQATGGGLISTNYKMANCLIANTLAAGAEASNYTPPCNALAGFISIVCQDSTYNTPSNPARQPTINFMPLQCTCPAT